MTHLPLALDLYRRGRHAEAEAACRRIPEGHPEFPAGLYLRGVVARDRGDLPKAIGLLRDAIDLDRGNPIFHSTFAAVLEEAGREAEAVAPYRRALALGHRPAQTALALGRLLGRLGRREEAAAALAASLDADPGHPETHLELGDLRRSLGDPRGALAAYDAGLSLAPDHPALHGHRALALLLLGDLKGGFAEYEWRWRDPAFRSTPLPPDVPPWRGEPLADRTLRLVAEQGFGDTFQFLRYASLAAERGARVQVLCQPKLVPLAATVPGVVAARAFGEELAPADFQIAMMSLPARFGTGADDVPAPIPYIHPPPERIAYWKNRLASLPGRKLGLVWRGATSTGRAFARADALRAADLAPLPSLPDVTVISLQKDPEPAELAELPGILHLEEAVATFAETAAALKAVDLLVSIDTATVHLAGAMGVPARVLLVPVHDWRWMLGRDDSPWYPSVRLHRRGRDEDWAEAVRRLCRDLDRSGMQS
jgi:Flp pilus assembly protein TadD